MASLIQSIKHVVVISKGKGKTANNLSTDFRQRQFERVGVTEDLILMEFVKFDNSEKGRIRKVQLHEGCNCLHRH